jgi:flagellar basal-body rod protein FlgB
MQGDAIPVLEQLVRFAGQRQRIIAHNIANASTPDFVQTDVSPAAFQKVLGEAVQRRRARGAGSADGSAHRLEALSLRETREIGVSERGELRLTPLTPRRGLLLHDRNNRDIERLMQDLAENTGVFRVATDLLRSRYQVMNAAISERP